LTFFYFSDEATVEDATIDGETAVLPVGGEIDYAASPQLREQIGACIKSGVRHLVLDLSQVTFIDSTAVGVLVHAAIKLQEDTGGSLVVVCSNPNVLQIFELTGLDSTIALHDSREQALSALALAG
jgi:anti-sigma B factor antagonist